MERHEQHTFGHDIGDSGLCQNTAAAGGDLYAVAGQDAQLGGIGRIDLHIGTAGDIHQAFHTAGHGAGVVMVEDSAGGEDHGEFCVGRFCAGTVRCGLKQGTLTAAELANVQNGGTGMVSGGAGPLEAAFFQTLIAHTAVRRRHSGHFGKDFLGSMEGVLIAQRGHHVGENLKVRLAFAQTRNGLADPLDPAFGVGEGAILFGEGAAGQDYICQCGGFRQENVLDHQEFAVFQGVFHMVQVGIGHHGILTHDIQAPYAASFHGVHDFSNGQAGFTGEGNTPGLFKLFPGSVVEDLLIGGEIGGQTAHVTGTLDIVLTAQGVDTAAVLADLAAQQCQVGGAHDTLGAGGVLSDTHGIVDTGFVCLGVQAGSLLQLFGIDLADFGHHLGGVVLDHFHQSFIALGALVDILLVLQALGDDDIHHAVEQGNVGAGLDLQEHIGFPAQRNAAGLSHDDLGTLALGLTDQGADDGVGLGGIGAGYEDHILVGGFGDGIGHGTGAKGDGETGNSGGVAQTCAVVHIVGADGGPHHLLEDIVILVGAAGAGKTCQSVGTGFGLDGADLVSDQADGFFPAGFGQNTVLADQGFGQAVFVVDKVVAELALDTEQTLVGFSVQRLGTHYHIVLDNQVQLAADTAVGAGGGDLFGFKGTVADLGLGKQGTHGADGDTVAAGDTVGAPDQLIEGCGNLGLEATASNADGGFAMEFLADIHTTLAQDALLGIISKEFVGIVDGVVVLHAGEAGLLHAVFIAQVLQLAFAVLGAAEAVGVVGGEHQIQYGPAGGDNLLRFCMDYIALCHGGGAGGEQLGVALDFHQTDTAGSLRGQVLQIAKSGDFDTHTLGSLQNGAALLDLYADAVNCYVQHNFLLKCTNRFHTINALYAPGRKKPIKLQHFIYRIKL